MMNGEKCYTTQIILNVSCYIEMHTFLSVIFEVLKRTHNKISKVHMQGASECVADGVV